MRKIACLILLLVGSAVPLAACGTDDVNPNAVAEAADKTASVKGVRITGTAETALPGGAGQMKMTMNGVADIKGKKSKIETKIGEIPGLPEGMEASDLNMEAIQDGTTMYMKSAMFEKELGAEWAKIDLQKALEGMGVDFGALNQASSMNPAEQLKYLRQAGDIEEVDKNHYKGTIDIKKMPGGDKLAELSGASTMPVELWIGDNGYVERYAMTMSQKIEGQTIETKMDTRFSDFGIAVDIRPPTDDVKDMTDLAKKGISEGN